LKQWICIQHLNSNLMDGPHSRIISNERWIVREFGLIWI